MCQVLNVSRSGYYAFIKRPESNRAKVNARLLTAIQKIHKENHEIYGYLRIAKALPDDMKASKHTVYRIMKENGIQSKTKRKYKATTNSKHNLPVAENLLNRDFSADSPNKKWVSDITYLWTDEGWLYIAGILDLCGRSLVGWAMDSTMKTKLVVDALNQAVGRTGAGKGLLIHSDRGVQYASKEYQKHLAKHGFICSMSRKGNCYDNAPMESFWGKLKSEWLYGRKFRTRKEAKKAVFEYIELFYNSRRLHSTNQYLSPMQVKNAA
jgi:transposase InsO family protein